jgi:potassium efflux system protein
MPLSHELHAAITHTLRDAGIQIPFPQRDIHIKTDA